MTLTGQVIAVQANFYRVSLDQAVNGTDRLLCVRRSRLKKIGQQVVVGDRVVIGEPDWQGGRGAIEEVLDRNNLLERPAMANIDRIVLLFSLKDPEPEPMQISRFLVHGESLQAQIILCLNKRDLVDETTWKFWQSRLLDWGYDPIPLSVEQNYGIDRLQVMLKSGVGILCGPSGVGKSSLINHLITGQAVATGSVDRKFGRGKHTTRHVELFDLEQGGRLADSPGFLQPQLPILSGELANCFPEIRSRLESSRCGFDDCQHLQEPDCAVGVNWERYSHYCSFLMEVQSQQAKQATTTNPDREFKQKSKSGGKKSLEPRISKKKYRRESRRSLIQSVDQELEGTGQS